MTLTAERRRSPVVALWSAGRVTRLEASLAVVRAVLVLLSIASLTALPEAPPGAITAHLGLLAACAVPVLALPAARRADRQEALGLATTLTTLAFYVGYTLETHNTHGAATAVGVLALLEAPLRYGPRGVLLSLPPVMGVALTHPAHDAGGFAPSARLSTVLCVLLLGTTLLLRASWQRWSSALDEAQKRLSEALVHLPLGVALVDGDGTVLHANPALAVVLGLRDPAALTGRALADSLPPPAPGGPDRRPLLSGGDPLAAGWEYETADGRWLSVGCSPVQVSVSSGGSVVHVSDITAARREHADLVRVARHDALTGLLTRAAGTQALTEALCSHAATAVLFLDIDGFKRLNDTAGHAAGDAVLRRAAARVQGSLRPTESAVRWGGDEFVVVCRDVDDDLALGAVAARLLQQLREPFSVDGVGTVPVTASLGASRAWPGATSQQVVDAADAAMYDAKRAGGDRCALARSRPDATEPRRHLPLDLPPPRTSAEHRSTT